MPQYFRIGKLVASTGLKGDIVLQHNLGKKTSLKGLEALFVEVNRGEMLPYFIQSAKIKSESLSLAKNIYDNILKKDVKYEEVWIAFTCDTSNFKYKNLVFVYNVDTLK